MMASGRRGRYLPPVRDPRSGLTRRRLLGGGLAAAMVALTSRSARAIGPGSKFRFGQLQLGQGSTWNPRPSALRRMGWEIENRTSIDVELEPSVVTPTSDSLHETPFLYLAGEREIELPGAAGIESLRRFLTFGGFLLIDSAEGSTDGAFDGSVRKLMAAVFPTVGSQKSLELVPSDHVVYKSFYLLDKPQGRLAIQPAMEGVFRDKRLVAAYVANDLGGAWSRDDFGNYDFRCEPGGERQRELAFRMGVNLVMYALCLDYKADQVHVPFIMKRRRWKPDDGALTPGTLDTKP
ncbi:hypothetical protein BH11MYX3_BH11MYX3_03060 [soil metagenome]